ncbi:acetyl-CoA synthetase-like protein [Polyplosphaeria fusca]|uniref:Acetyl-CoA synthetase-like protein n=1 Tax=Polyplosphaeria fusca TaxID=682080 RepID=A0A9P4RBH7_9PLEO|nr:acetyl-CoA synthetase-like protein [Polyplosphaeria fusca]
MQPNYFVCTLGRASALKKQHPKSHQTIGGFLEHQAHKNPFLPAVGFPIPNHDQSLWNHEILTFRDIDKVTQVFASRLLCDFEAVLQKPQAVALLCDSSLEFLIAWLALIRLGHAVLLIAPQCHPSAIRHLCHTCEVSALFHDKAHLELASRTDSFDKSQDDPSLQIRSLPEINHEDFASQADEGLGWTITDENSIAYLHHTSGTSSGLPKPIPQSHRAAIGVLPYLPEKPPKATFSTTPLYHGGIADLFRAWTSDAMIWLFPGNHVPITARNIYRSIAVAHECSVAEGRPLVKFFSSVPYVLQMMEADKQCLEQLRQFDLVGVGGAALPGEVGDRLVKNGVKLLSRFGSAECGFLLSSYRDFNSDKDWQYLRDESPSNILLFESREDGLSELVVQRNWPHLAKVNRPNGSFATADLFARHPTIRDAWLYHSRADSQLTLITGKKFDPAPLEATIAMSPHLDNVLIFGNHRAFPGALLFRSQQARESTDEELIRDITPIVEESNNCSQSHTRIPCDMLIPMPHVPEGLEKSSKGTILRKAVESRFKNAIETAYDVQNFPGKILLSNKDVPDEIERTTQQLLHRTEPIHHETDLFSYGMDSIACMQLRRHLQRLLHKGHDEVPLTIVEDCGTIRRLGDYVVQKRCGAVESRAEDEFQLMHDLVEQFGKFEPEASGYGCFVRHDHKESGLGDVVILTGATGALGSHILDRLRAAPHTRTIYCLVRGTSEIASRERVSKALEQRGCESLATQSVPNKKIKILTANLGEPRLGLTDAVYERLAAESDIILHVAWTVNFRLNLRSFAKDSIAGVRHLIDLATSVHRHSRPRFVYCSSTAAVANAGLEKGHDIPEQFFSDPSVASSLGYSQSKWVAEQICLNAARATHLRVPIAVVRVGQLSGDRQHGIWNASEAWPLMLSTVKFTGSLPNLGDDPLDWLPVDVAANAFIEVAQQVGVEPGQALVYHILNPCQKPTWNEMLQWRKKENFDIVSPSEWVHRLEAHQDTEHPALKLLGLWREAYCHATSGSKSRPRFSVSQARARVSAMRDVEPVTEVYMCKLWQWVQANVG